jgi:hypothetical protein
MTRSGASASVDPQRLKPLSERSCKMSWPPVGPFDRMSATIQQSLLAAFLIAKLRRRLLNDRRHGVRLSERRGAALRLLASVTPRVCDPNIGDARFASGVQRGRGPQALGARVRATSGQGGMEHAAAGPGPPPQSTSPKKFFWRCSRSLLSCGADARLKGPHVRDEFIGTAAEWQSAIATGNIRTCLRTCPACCKNFVGAKKPAAVARLITQVSDL